MSRKHFESFAAKIREMLEKGHENEAKAAADMVVSVAEAGNERFDAGRFYSACGL